MELPDTSQRTQSSIASRIANDLRLELAAMSERKNS